MGYADNNLRLHEIRFSWDQLNKETGCTSYDIERRIVDYGLNQYFKSHEPWIVPEPMTPEPSETYSKDDLDEFCEILKTVADECYSDPEMVKGAPYNAPVHLVKGDWLSNPEKSIMTRRAYIKNINK